MVQLAGRRNKKASLNIRLVIQRGRNREEAVLKSGMRAVPLLSSYDSHRCQAVVKSFLALCVKKILHSLAARSAATELFLNCSEKARNSPLFGLANGQSRRKSAYPLPRILTLHGRAFGDCF